MISRLRSLAYMLPHLVRTLLSPGGTVRYPQQPLCLPAYYRGRVTVDISLCRGCGACVRDCPAEAMELERKSRTEFRLLYYPDRCAFCGQCELSCPTDAVYMTNAYPAPTVDREALVEVLVERTG